MNNNSIVYTDKRGRNYYAQDLANSRLKAIKTKKPFSLDVDFIFSASAYGFALLVTIFLAFGG